MASTLVGNTLAQTTTWTGDDGNVWTRDGSWNQGQPDAVGTAIFSASAGSGSIALRESGSPGSVSVGTIVINSTAFTGFSAGAAAATLNFGSGTSGITFEPTGSGSGTLTLGSGSDPVRTVIGQMLSLQVKGANTLSIDSNIEGAGSVVLSTI